MIWQVSLSSYLFLNRRRRFWALALSLTRIPWLSIYIWHCVYSNHCRFGLFNLAIISAHPSSSLVSLSRTQISTAKFHMQLMWLCLCPTIQKLLIQAYKTLPNENNPNWHKKNPQKPKRNIIIPWEAEASNWRQMPLVGFSTSQMKQKPFVF